MLLQSNFLFVNCLCRYLSLVEGAQLYAVLRDSTKAVVSLPPVTNSERSKVRLHKQSFNNTKHTQETLRWEVYNSLKMTPWSLFFHCCSLMSPIWGHRRTTLSIKLKIILFK